MGSCAHHGYYATNACDRCYPQRECDECAAKEERIVALEESDGWMVHAKEFYASGGCPVCFCSDEGPHEKGCYWSELESRIAELEKVVEMTVESQEWDGSNPNEDRWTELYTTARAALLKEGE